MARWKENQYEYTLDPNLIWKKSPNGQYWVSENGDVYVINTGYKLNVKPCKRSGYYKIGRDTGFSSLHRLVYSSFVGDIPEGMQINHIDGNKANNHISNLEVCTPSENVRHAYELGLASGHCGEANGNAKVTEEDVRQMYGLFKLGYSNKDVGDIYGLSDRYISLVRHGHRWKELWEELGMYRTPSLGRLPFTLSKCVYIYNKCLLSGKPQDVLAKELGIDSSTVSRIRTGATWKAFRQFFGVPERTLDWKDSDNLAVDFKETPCPRI